MTIYREPLSDQNKKRSANYRQFQRRRLKQKWPSYVENRKHWMRALLHERASRDPRAVIERNSIVGIGIRFSNGSIMIAGPRIPRYEKPKSRKPSKLKRPAMPCLIRLLDDNDRVIRLRLLTTSSKRKFIRKPMP